MIKLQCWKCGLDIYRTPSKVSPRSVCSGCYSEGRGQYITCKREECDNQFYAYPSDTRIYCSQPCTKAEQRKSAYGNTYTDKDGYVRVLMPDHPNARKDGRVYKHTLVMSEMLGRPLFPKEEVHHKNGFKDDNDPGNLELWTKSQPAGQRVEDKIAWAIEFLHEYGYEVKS